ncbi:hypothetical protein L7F22_062418 [Adiantum nelumboides]|nr:hypothetical protein [Adiantum nelumboides]
MRVALHAIREVFYEELANEGSGASAEPHDSDGTGKVRGVAYVEEAVAEGEAGEGRRWSMWLQPTRAGVRQRERVLDKVAAGAAGGVCVFVDAGDGWAIGGIAGKKGSRPSFFSSSSS